MKASSTLSIYTAFIHNAFLKMLAYRLRYYTGILTYLLFVSVYYFIWQTIYADKPPGSSINGFTLPEMITYLAVGWMARSFYFTNVDYDIDHLVRSGEITSIMIRPINFQAMMFSQAIGEAIFRASFFSLPISICLSLVFPVQAPVSFQAGLLFGLSTLLGFFVLTALNFLVGLSAFFLESIDGLCRAKYGLVQLASGLLLPLAFFPDWLRPTLDALPFKAICYVPLQVYLGKLSSTELIWQLELQVCWAFGLMLAGHLMWLKARAHLSLQGG